MMPKRLTCAFAAVWIALACQPLVAGAETVYVSNELKLAVHERASLDSAVIRLVPMGAPLELLERKGPVTHVRIGTGVDGWVQSTFLSAKPPVRNEPNAEQASQLNGIRTELKAMEQRAIIAETKLLTLEAAGNANSESDSDTRQGSKDTDAASDRTPPKAIDNAAHSDMLRDVERLTLINQRLRSQLAARDEQAPQPDGIAAGAATAAGIAAAASLGDNTGEGEPGEIAKAIASLIGDREKGPIDWLASWSRWQWLFSGCAALLALSLGAWMVDTGVRRRLGGFSV